MEIFHSQAPPFKKSTATFPRFLELPKELQIEVWKYATHFAWEQGRLSLIAFGTTKRWDTVPCLGSPYSGKILYIKEHCYMHRYRNTIESGFETLLDPLQTCSLSRVVTFEWMKKKADDEYTDFAPWEQWSSREPGKENLSLTGELKAWGDVPGFGRAHRTDA